MTPRQVEFRNRTGFKIHAAEKGCDIAIERVAHLLAELPAARSGGGIGAEIGQSSVHALTKATRHLAKAREQIVIAHREMAAGAEASGYTPFTGEWGNKPPPNAQSDEPIPLRAVG